MQPFSTLNNPLIGTSDLGVLGRDQMELLSQDQADAYIEANDPENILAVQRAQLGLEYPQQNYQVSAQSVPEGIMKGLANVASAIPAQRQFARQNQVLQDMAAAQQQYMNTKRDMALNQIRAQQDRDNQALSWLRANRPDLADPFMYNSPENRVALIKSIGDKTLDLSFAPDEGRAEGQKEIGKKSAILKHAQDSGYGPGSLEVGGIPQPGRINSYSYLTGQKPVTSLDINSEYLDNQTKDVNLQKGKNELQVQPRQLQQDIYSKELQNSIGAVNAKYAGALKKIDLLTGENKLEEAEKAKTNLEQGKQRYNQMLKVYDKLTEGEIKLFNSQMKSIGLPYELPGKTELKATTIDGKVGEFYDPVTGEIKPAVRPKK